MSRSFRKNPFCGWTTAKSEKQDKRIANRRYRRVCKQLLRMGDALLPLMREMTDVYNWAKDGKQRLTDAVIARSPKLMRK